MARDWLKLSLGFARNGRLAEACAESTNPAAVYLTLLILNQEFGTDGVIPKSKVENPARLRAAGSALLGSMSMKQIGTAMELIGAAGLISSTEEGVRINGYGPDHMPPCSQCHGPNPSTASRCPKCASKRRKNGPAMEHPRPSHGRAMDPREEKRSEEIKSEDGGGGSSPTVPEPGTTESLYDEIMRTAESLGVHDAAPLAKSLEEQGGTAADLAELANLVGGDDPAAVLVGVIRGGSWRERLAKARARAATPNARRSDPVDPEAVAMTQAAVESLVDGVFELSPDEAAGVTRIARDHGSEAILDVIEYFASKEPGRIASLCRRFAVETPDVIAATVEASEKASSSPRVRAGGSEGSRKTLVNSDPLFGE